MGMHSIYNACLGNGNDITGHAGLTPIVICVMKTTLPCMHVDDGRVVLHDHDSPEHTLYSPPEQTICQSYVSMLLLPSHKHIPQQQKLTAGRLTCGHALMRGTDMSDDT